MGKKKKASETFSKPPESAEKSGKVLAAESLHNLKLQAFQDLAAASTSTQRLIALRDLLDVAEESSDEDQEPTLNKYLLRTMANAWRAMLNPSKQGIYDLKTLIWHYHEILAQMGEDAALHKRYGKSASAMRASLRQKLGNLPDAQSRLLLAYLEDPRLMPENDALDANFNRPESALRTIFASPPKFSVPRSGNNLRASATLHVLKEGKRQGFQTGIFSSPMAAEAAKGGAGPASTLNFRFNSADMMALAQLNSYAQNHGLIFLPGVLWLDLNTPFSPMMRNMLQLYSKILPNLIICIRYLQVGNPEPSSTLIQGAGPLLQLKAKQSNGIWQMAMKGGQVYWM